MIQLDFLNYLFLCFLEIKNLKEDEETKNPEINDAALNEDMEIDESPRKEA